MSVDSITYTVRDILAELVSIRQLLEKPVAGSASDRFGVSEWQDPNEFPKEGEPS